MATQCRAKPGNQAVNRRPLKLLRIDKRRRSCLHVHFALLLLMSIGDAKAWWWDAGDKHDFSTVTELGWSDLVPDDFVQGENPLHAMSRDERDKLFDGSEESKDRLLAIEKKLSYSPVVAKLNNRQIKLPGYVVPIAYDAQRVLTEFFLVPYYGACIHTPPPPANQLVFAKAATSITISNTFDPVWAVGTIKTETFEHGIAEAGYILELDAVLPYE